MLHALDLTTGADKPGSPIDMGLDANGQPLSVNGSGDGTTSGKIVFDPIKHQNRVALTLSQGVLTVGFASHCDQNNYHGWVLRFDTTSSPIRPLAPYMTNPNTGHGGLWQGGGGFPVDASGNLYMVSGDGRIGDHEHRRHPAGERLHQADQRRRRGHAHGRFVVHAFGRGVARHGRHRHRQLGTALDPGDVVAGWRAARTASSTSSTPRAIRWDTSCRARRPTRRLSSASPASSTSGQIVGGPAWWDGPCGLAPLRVAGRLDAGRVLVRLGRPNLFNTTAASRSADVATGGDAQGGQLSLSANGSTSGTGIVWATRALGSTGGGGFNSNSPVGGALYAFNAENVATKLWDSTMVASDKLANAPKYIAPTIANGKVYVGTLGAAPSSGGEVAVYGLFNPPSDGGVGGSSGSGGSAGSGGTGGFDAGVSTDAGSPPTLTCATVDGGAPQPTSWTYVYNTYFAGHDDRRHRRPLLRVPRLDAGRVRLRCRQGQLLRRAGQRRQDHPGQSGHVAARRSRAVAAGLVRHGRPRLPASSPSCRPISWSGTRRRSRRSVAGWERALAMTSRTDRFAAAPTSAPPASASAASAARTATCARHARLSDRLRQQQRGRAVRRRPVLQRRHRAHRHQHHLHRPG